MRIGEVVLVDRRLNRSEHKGEQSPCHVIFIVIALLSSIFWSSLRFCLASFSFYKKTS